MLHRCLFIALFLLGLTSTTVGQALSLVIWPDSAAALIKDIPSTISDSNSVEPVLESIVSQLRWLGHLESAVDQIQLRDSTLEIQLHLGPIYHWMPLDLAEIPENLLRDLGFQKFKWEKTPVRLTQLQSWQQEILAYAENNGYPFAAVQLEPFLTEKNELGGKLRFGLGPNIRLDTLQVVGDIELSTFYIQSYLGLEPGQAYNQEKLNQSEKRLRDLPFVQVKQGTDLQFFKDKVRPVFHLQKKKASRFDFIIGVLPNNSQTGRLLVTGDLEGELINAFGKGERLYAHFEQLRPATQELELALAYPYLFRLPFGTEVAFNIYKRDSAFLDVELDVGIQYLLEGGNYLKVFWQQQNSNLLNINEALLLQRQELPQQLDIRQSIFGLQLYLQRLNNRFNPRRGWITEFRAGAGNKRIRRNVQIEEIGLGPLYDTLQLNTLQFQIEGQIAAYFPLFRRSTLKVGANLGLLLSDGLIYQNEQYRVGGNRLLRGFDEEFFFATNYLVATLEYRLLLSENAFLFAFGDAAWLENRTVAQAQVTYPYSMGAGISLETSAGLFSISLAYGKEQNTTFNLNNPKVHFGYISLF